jgi:hypothetical protein
MELRDYLIDQQGKDWPDLLSDWLPALPQRFTVWLVNRFGDIFFVPDDGSVHMLDIGSGQVERVADNREDFAERIDQEDNAENWLMISLVDQCVAAGMRLDQTECYGFKRPPILGGTYDVENIEPTDLSVHFSLLGEIYWQVKGLPEGTPIAKITLEDR